MDYIGALITFVFAGILTFSMIFLTSVLGPKRRSAAKDIPYETGKDPFSLPGRMKVSVHFYVIAMVFLVLDLAIAFLYPWAVLFRTLGWGGLGAILLFMFFILLGYFYAWKMKSLDIS